MLFYRHVDHNKPLRLEAVWGKLRKLYSKAWCDSFFMDEEKEILVRRKLSNRVY